MPLRTAWALTEKGDKKKLGHDTSYERTANHNQLQEMPKTKKKVSEIIFFSKITGDSQDVRSVARKAAVVSVEKRGFPEPPPTPPKITTLPFSRCLIARCLLYGSPTSGRVKAVCTRV